MSEETPAQIDHADERAAGLRTELVAGLTTFFTMAYIVVVNPLILSTEGTGMPFGGVLTALRVAIARAAPKNLWILDFGLGIEAKLATEAQRHRGKTTKRVD